jgi:malonyl-CoA O-methyltransferase
MKTLVKNRFRRSLSTYDDNAQVQKIICEQLILLTARHQSAFNKVYEIGAGTGLLTRMILGKFSVKDFLVNDFIGDIYPLLADVFRTSPAVHWEFQSFDAESSIPGSGYDLVISSSTFQWFQQLETFFTRIGPCLVPGGIFAFNTYGEQNLEECRALTGQGLKYYSMAELLELLLKDFIQLEVGENTISLVFETPREVLLHLKKTGVNSLWGNGWTKRDLDKFESDYREQFSCQGGVSLTYHPQYFVLQKR